MNLRSAIRILVLAAAALVPASCLEVEYADGDSRVGAYCGIPMTKATLLEDVPDDIAVWGYVWPLAGSQGTPNWMCGETFSRSGTLWMSARTHGNIPQGYRVRLWSVAPVGAAGVSSLPLAATSSAPGFVCTPPADVSLQEDVLVACGDPFDVQPASFPLLFRHALSCVLYRTALADVPDCTVESVTLSGVAATGTYTEGDDWGSLTGTASYTIEPHQAITAADTDVTIGTASDAVLVVPQVLPGGAKVSVTYSRAGATNTVDADLEGVELPMGYKVVLRLAIPPVAGAPLDLTVTVTEWGAGPEFNSDGGAAFDPLFSVAADKDVFFSQGNLRYQPSSQTFRFADSGEDVLMYAPGNTIGGLSNRADTEEWLDWFAWGCTGYSYRGIGESEFWERAYRIVPHGSELTLASTFGPDYSGGNAVALSVAGLSDWGACDIENAGGRSWRTLTKDEWTYLMGGARRLRDGRPLRVWVTLSDRTVPAYGGTVAQTGLLLLPDAMPLPDGEITAEVLGGSVTLSTSRLQALEALGAAFLPAASRITCDPITAGTYHDDTACFYWSASPSDEGGLAERRNAYGFYMGGAASYAMNTYNRGGAMSVRLVSDNE